MPELCADELVVGGGVWWSYDRRCAAHFFTAVYMLDAGLFSHIIVSNENFNHRGIIMFSIHNI